MSEWHTFVNCGPTSSTFPGLTIRSQLICGDTISLSQQGISRNGNCLIDKLIDLTNFGTRSQPLWRRKSSSMQTLMQTDMIKFNHNLESQRVWMVSDALNTRIIVRDCGD